MYGRVSLLDMANLESALDELICPLCIDTFVQPRSLQCLHSYCEVCLQGLQKATTVSGGVSCPECRAWTELPPGGVKGMLVSLKKKRHGFDARALLSMVQPEPSFHRVTL